MVRNKAVRDALSINLTVGRPASQKLRTLMGMHGVYSPALVLLMLLITLGSTIECPTVRRFRNESERMPNGQVYPTPLLYR